MKGGGFLNSTHAPNGFNGWLALHTKSLSIPQYTIDAQGSRTFRTNNEEKTIYVSGMGPSSVFSHEEQGKQILATSTISSKVDVKGGKKQV